MISEAEKIAAKLLNCASVQDARDTEHNAFREKVSEMLWGLYGKEKRKEAAQDLQSRLPNALFG